MWPPNFSATAGKCQGGTMNPRLSPPMFLLSSCGSSSNPQIRKQFDFSKQQKILMSGRMWACEIGVLGQTMSRDWVLEKAGPNFSI